MVAVNGRILQYKLTGVQRYLLELLDRFESRVKVIQPEVSASGVKGHGWEQFVLPFRLRGQLLFSPSNTGPLLYDRQVVTVHDVVPLEHPEWLNASFAAWYSHLTPKLVHRARHIITISEFTKGRIVERTGIMENKISVILNGVDARFRPHGEEDIQHMISSLALPSRHYILSLGSLEPRKNLERLLKSWVSVNKRVPEDVWLVVAGGKGSHQVFGDVNLNRNLPRVHFTGHVPDNYLPALYAGALAFAYLSFYEGFGLPPLEAMASGTPVLTGNKTAIPEVVADAGIMVDPHDDEAISDALLRLVASSSLRDDLRRRGLARAGKFSWDVAAEQTWNVLERVACQ